MEHNVDFLYVEIKLEIMRKTFIKRLEVRYMTWLLVEHDVDVLHIELEFKIAWIACVKRLKVSDIT